MVFGAKCSCPWHEQWRFGAAPSEDLRLCSREEEKSFGKDEKHNNRKRKVCVLYRSRLEVEAKCRKLEVRRFFELSLFNYYIFRQHDFHQFWTILFVSCGLLLIGNGFQKMFSHFCVLCCFLISYKGCLVHWENTGSIPDFVSCKAFSMHRIAEGLKISKPYFSYAF